MKFSKAILTLSCALLLASCGEGESKTGIGLTIAGDTTVEVGAKIKLNVTITNDGERKGYTLTSSNDALATVDEEGYVIGVAEGEVTITAASLADPDVTATWDVDIIASTIPSASISAFSETLVVGGKTSLTAEIYNPTSYTPIIHWTTERGKGSILGGRTENATFSSNSVGNEIVGLEVNIGPYCIKDELQIFISDNYTDPAKDWKEVGDAETFTEYFLNGSTGVSGNYYLTADIDLNGVEVNAAMHSKIAGTLDGRGHKIFNFTLAGETPDKNGASANAGLFNGVGAQGAIRNLAIDVNMGQSASGWGSSALTNGADGTIENVLVNVEHSFDSGEFATEENNYYVPFNAGLVGVPAAGSHYFDCVVNVTGVGASTVYADAAYPSGYGTAQTFKFDGFYTNSSNVGGQQWDWGAAVNDLSGYTIGIDWNSANASTYRTLSSSVWNLTDGAMPTLKVI